MMAPMKTVRTRRNRYPRVFFSALLLTGLFVREIAAAGTEAQVAATIAQRSFGGSEARNIARRSLAGSSQIVVPQDRFAAVRTAATAPVARHTSLDAVRLERTDRYRDLIEHHSRLNHVEAALVQAIIYTESGGDALAVSPAGARGLMQLMPETARQLGVRDPQNPEQSIASGIRHLRNLLDQYGSTELALWAYNAGPGAVQRGVLPAETKTYVPRVLAVRRALAARPHGSRQVVR